ncbi:hypothetical protein [Bacillus sp. FJAT-42315]|uniref:hypothetical protein n=1 Tax=Bacillus sp. FJAT-42315 TaxID=2014077 RepID=UPI000C24B656|nr:hypothetical protein [Bacillus sp. FJAT-42315]
MNAMYSAIAFIVVVVLTYPLYESFGGIAFAIAGISGIVVAFLSYQVMSKKSQQQQKDLNQLAELLKSSNDEVVKSLKTHNEQIDENLQSLTKDLHNKLEKSWGSLQDITQKNHKQSTEQIHCIITQVNDVQKIQQQKQQELFDLLEQKWKESKQQYENWFEDQQKANKEALKENEDIFKKLSSTLQSGQQHLVELIDTTQNGLLDKFKSINDEQLKIRLEEQQSWQDLLAQMKEKESAFETYLNTVQHNFDEAQKLLGQNILSKLEATNKGLMTAWQTLQENQLSIREEERNEAQATLYDFQQAASRMNDNLTATWEKAQQNTLQIRKEEQQKFEHMITVIEEKEQVFSRYLQQFDEKTTESHNNFVELTSGVTNTLYTKLVDLWKSTQQEYNEYLTNLKSKEEENQQTIISLLETKSEQSNSILQEVWTTIQQQMNDLRQQEHDQLTATIAEVSTTNNEVNQQLLENWQTVQDQLLQIRDQEQEKLTVTLESLNSKGEEFSQYLQHLGEVTEKSQLELLTAVTSQNEQTSNKLLNVWSIVQEGIKVIRQEEQEQLKLTLGAVEQREQAMAGYLQQFKEETLQQSEKIVQAVASTNEKIGLQLRDLWNDTLVSFAAMREQEQEKLEATLAAMEKKEQAFTSYLVEVKDTTAQTQQTLIEAVAATNAETSNSLLKAWNTVQTGILALQQKEREKLHATLQAVEEKERAYSEYLVKAQEHAELAQQQLLQLLDKKVNEQNSALLSTWNELQNDAKRLREREHTSILEMLDVIEEKDQSMKEHLVYQAVVFKEAQKDFKQSFNVQTQALYDELFTVWNKTQNEAAEIRQAEQQILTDIVENLKQQEEKFQLYLTTSLETQQQAQQQAQQQFQENLEQFQEQSLKSNEQFVSTVSKQSEAVNDSILQVWNGTQEKLLKLRNEEQQTLQRVMASLEEKEQNLFVNVEKLQKQLANQALNSTEAVNAKLLEAWNNAQSQVLLLRQQEREQLESVLTSVEQKEQAFTNYLEELTEKTEEAQQQFTNTADETVKKTNAQITEKWTTTQQQLVELRSKDQKDVQKLISKLDNQSNMFMKQLEQQHKTFDNAQQYYGKATETIEEFTGRIVNQTKQIDEQHERLVQAQEMLEKSITTTLKDILGNHSAVLINAEKSLKTAIDVLQKEGLENQKALIENVEVMVEEVTDMRNLQEEILKDLTAKLNINMRNLNEAITESTYKQTRSVDNYTMSLEETLNRLDALINSEQSAQKELSTQLRAQTSEMKESANTLRNTYNELKAMNKEDMKILAELIK